jgi:alpha-1,2-mannosyltransferase
VAFFIASLLSIYAMLPAGPHHREGSAGTDFIAFYTAGVFVRNGKARSLYDLHAISQYQHALAHQNGDDLGQAIGPWWNPPYYAWLFVPLAKFTYPTALKIWLAVNLICAGAAAAILISWVRRASPGGPGTWALVPVLIALSTPFMQSLTHAQNTCTSLLLLSLVVMAWRTERPLLAGLVLGTLAYKPQLVALVALVMAICLGWRVVIGLGITGAVLLAVNLLTLPGTLGDYQQRLPLNLHFVLYEVPYLWDRHVTFRALWRLVFQGFSIGESSVTTWAASSLCCIGLGAYLFSTALRTRSARPHLLRNGRRFDRLIAATIVSTPLLMPFYFDYDQLLLAIPAVLLAVEMLQPGQSAVTELPRLLRPSFVIGVWSTWYGWLMINPDVATMTRVNGTVLLLSVLSLTLIGRAMAATTASLEIDELQEPPQRALAA